MKSRQRRGRRDKVTLNDVARIAGVSPITVSRALRSPEKVSEDLRRRILGIVEQTGYVPDFAARALASSNSDVIGVVLPTLSNFALMMMMQGVEDRINPTGYRIQYANTRFDPAEEANQIKLFLAQNPLAVLVSGISSTAARLLADANCPVVEVIDVSEPMVDMAIGIDTRRAAVVATEHLLAQGYRRIGLLGGRANGRSRLRHDGFRSVLEADGLYDPALDVFEDAATSAELGCRLLRTLLARFPDADGAFCHNDDIALGVLFECQRLGIRVPEQFGICGFNDLEFAAVAEPPITSVHVPRYDLGVRAAELIIGSIAKEARPSMPVDVGFTLMERGSTRRRV